MKLYLATTNKNKIKEIRDFVSLYFESLSTLKPALPPVFIEGLDSFSDYKPPEETGRSFLENADIKSRHFKEYLKKKPALREDFFGILAEDSGLEVRSLKGAPGVFSARYAGLDASDKQNNEKILKNLQGEKNREARYVCALSSVFIQKKKRMAKETFQAFCKGKISRQEKGQGGFGYDPLFIPEGQSQTFAELPPSFKSSLSHRRKALEQCFNYMENKGFFSSV